MYKVVDICLDKIHLAQFNEINKIDVLKNCNAINSTYIFKMNIKDLQRSHEARAMRLYVHFPTDIFDNEFFMNSFTVT